MVKVTWTLFAIDDLKDIHNYISKDSKTHADRFINSIIDKVDLLQFHPLSGRIVPEFEDQTIRELIHGNYRIIYSFDSDDLAIIRIHHSARLLK